MPIGDHEKVKITVLQKRFFGLFKINKNKLIEMEDLICFLNKIIWLKLL